MTVDFQGRPILFSGEMVRAILEGRKSQTRRIIKPQPEYGILHGPAGEICIKNPASAHERVSPGTWVRCPYGVPGDRLWVRETWRQSLGASKAVLYAADCSEYERKEKGPWRPSIFMPRWASRITLEVTEVRVERLQDISEQDAEAEGAVYRDFGANHWYSKKPGWTMFPANLEKGPDFCLDTARLAFGNLWNTINPNLPWNANQWVWVISFRRLHDDR